MAGSGRPGLPVRRATPARLVTRATRDRKGLPGGPPRIIGHFSRTPANLPASGLIPANWDIPGNPPAQVQVQDGQGLLRDPTGNLWIFTGTVRAAMAGWINAGRITGPPGTPGRPGTFRSRRAAG